MYEFLRCGIELDEVKIIDVYKLCTKLEKRRLKDAYKRFIGDDMDGAHDALNDIKATKKELIKLIKM